MVNKPIAKQRTRYGGFLQEKPVMTSLITSLIAQIVNVVYVGLKDRKTDTVTDTRLVWEGYGDKHPVPADKAAQLLRYKEVWVTEDEFKKIKSTHRMRKGVALRVEAELADKSDIELVDDGGEDEAVIEEATDEAASEQDNGVVGFIKRYVLDTDISKKPARKILQAALPELVITDELIDLAWRELGGH
jgi:hypothetical protein